jgi:hypothetical protein
VKYAKNNLEYFFDSISAKDVIEQFVLIAEQPNETYTNNNLK